MKNSVFVMITLVVLLGSGCFSKKAAVCIHNECVDVEVVSKPADLERGLQGHKELGPKEGMLFVFTKDGQHSFWMKDMTFSIDMIWFNQEGVIVHAIENAPPCRTEPCAIYTPLQPARFVLEVPSGYVYAHSLKVGDQYSLERLPKIDANF